MFDKLIFSDKFEFILETVFSYTNFKKSQYHLQNNLYVIFSDSLSFCLSNLLFRSVPFCLNKASSLSNLAHDWTDNNKKPTNYAIYPFHIHCKPVIFYSTVSWADLIKNFRVNLHSLFGKLGHFRSIEKLCTVTKWSTYKTWENLLQNIMIICDGSRQNRF